MKQCPWRSLSARLVLASAAFWLLVPAAIAGDKKHEKRDAAASFFAQTNVPLLVLEIPKAGLAALQTTQSRRVQNGVQATRPEVHATLREGATVYSNVAVHLKGAAGSFEPINRRPGFTLNLDKFVDGQVFHGLDKLSLNNSRQDPTGITDKLCREIYERAGVPAPRANYARLNLNGRDLGVYVVTEGWGKAFLKRYYKNTKGNLYDGGFVKDIIPPKEVNSGEHPEDSSDLEALMAATRERNLDKRLLALQKRLDVEKFITMLALDSLMWNWDGYGLNRNNYRVYHDLDHDKMVFMPHGMDQMFWTAEAPLLPAPKAMVAKAVLQIPELRQRYIERASELLDTALRLDFVTNRVQALAAQVQTAMLSGKQTDDAEGYMSEVDVLLNRIRLRMASAREQLASVKQVLKLETGHPIPLVSWDARASSMPHQPGPKGAGQELPVVATGSEAGKVWATTVWLEEGRYRLEGRIKTKAVKPAPDPDQTPGGDGQLAGGLFNKFLSMAQNPGGAGFRVWTHRKFTEGADWDWFPYRESRNFRRRGLIPSSNGCKRLSGDNDWTTVVYEFDLRAPIADLQIVFDMLATEGTAFLDTGSVTLAKLN